MDNLEKVYCVFHHTQKYLSQNKSGTKVVGHGIGLNQDLNYAPYRFLFMRQLN